MTKSVFTADDLSKIKEGKIKIIESKVKDIQDLLTHMDDACGYDNLKDYLNKNMAKIKCEIKEVLTAHGVPTGKIYVECTETPAMPYGDWWQTITRIYDNSARRIRVNTEGIEVECLVDWNTPQAEEKFSEDWSMITDKVAKFIQGHLSIINHTDYYRKTDKELDTSQLKMYCKGIRDVFSKTNLEVKIKGSDNRYVEFIKPDNLKGDGNKLSMCIYEDKIIEKRINKEGNEEIICKIESAYKQQEE